MNLEERLSDQLRQVADTAADPVVTVDGIARLGRRERNRRRALAGSAVAAVLAVGIAVPVGLGLGDRDTRPPIADLTVTRIPDYLGGLPAGRPAQLPFAADGFVYAGSAAIEVHASNLVYAGGTTVVGTDNGGSWFVLEGSRLRLLTDAGESGAPRISPGGAWIVWPEKDDDGWRIRVWDVAGSRAVDSWVPVNSGEGDAGLLTTLSVNDDGRVLFGDSANLQIWTPGADPVAVTGVDPATVAPRPWPGGVSYTKHPRRAFTSPGVFGTVDDDGVFERLGEVPLEWAGLWSTDGRYFGHAMGDGFAVRSADTGQETVLRLPKTLSLEMIGWESGTSLMMMARDPQHDREVSLIRCEAQAGACEVASNPLVDPVLPLGL